MMHSAVVSLPLTPTDLSLFIAYMFQNQYAPSTALTYVSALGYSHRLAGYPDPTKVFWVLEMLKGYKKLGARIDTRLPITLSILRNILRQVPALCSSAYETHLFTAMCSTAFFAFLRIGEITVCSRSPSVLHIGQVVKMVEPSGFIAGLKITFHDFKHSYNQRPVVLTLSRRSDICPVQNLLEYLSVRGLTDGPLFRMPSGSAVPRTSFTKFLSMLFRGCGLDTMKYKGHSFRIGAATFAAECGFSDAQIRAMGRWRSDAFLKYIRIPSLSSASS